MASRNCDGDGALMLSPSFLEHPMRITRSKASLMAFATTTTATVSGKNGTTSNGFPGKNGSNSLIRKTGKRTLGPGSKKTAGSRKARATKNKAWVRCDDCSKWRCISVNLCNSIGASDIRWSCRENPNKNFADCSVPQEITNAEINLELNISEGSLSESDDNEVSWTGICHNIFEHRIRKTLDNDNTFICQCRLPKDGSPGCGECCLNRVVNIECSPDTCPSGKSCSNQQFGKRMYSNVARVRCGKKGFGLRTLENVSKGTFIIEYVGEVLDTRAFEQRQKEYASQRHVYFMTLNTNEVIDACAKGNLGRFINHSCDPNCETQKWFVNGEICIGLFASKDIAANDEITLNYKLYGAVMKKCHCMSAQCRGYIGGDPSNFRNVFQSDLEEDMEPVDESEDKNIKSKASRKSEIEDELDKLLNESGGLVKKKNQDTPNQYLKLLVISTAYGDESKKGTFCRMRDLSLLLDVLLNTTSHSILSEIIQKNGLQLLHNLVKQSRKSYTKTLILRKLMKVLQSLADKTVLKSKHMTLTPPRSGMESFVESISELMRHEDTEVQQISCLFQKKWLPHMSSQKRELFCPSKPEEKLRRRPLGSSAGKNLMSQQDRKRPRRSLAELTESTSKASLTPASLIHSGFQQQHHAPAPCWIEQPGYLSASSNCQLRNLLQHQQPYPSRLEHWNNSAPYRSQSWNGYYELSQWPLGPYLPGMLLHQPHHSSKYQNHHQPVLPLVDEYYANSHQFGYQSMNGYYQGHLHHPHPRPPQHQRPHPRPHPHPHPHPQLGPQPQQQQQYHDENPPVPGL